MSSLRDRAGFSKIARWVIVAAAIGMSFPAASMARIADIELKDLAMRSHLIVVAKVLKVEDGPANPDQMDPSAPVLKIATAEVIETWKGDAPREVRFVASSTWVCDTTSAEQGERVVLFLERTKDSKFLSITHSGRGRMPIRDVEAKRYAVIDSHVILPEGTPRISEKKTVRMGRSSTNRGKANDDGFDFTYSVDSVELGVLQALVKSSNR